jgi:hypothetical protein
MRTCHPHIKLHKLALLCVAVALMPAFQLAAEEISGVVQSSTEKYATVRSTSELVPRPGDKAKIYFKLPGTDTEISVASGHVYEITGPNIMVQIDKASGSVAKDQLVRISSRTPMKQNANASDQSATGGDAAAVQDIEQVIRKINEAWEENDVAALDKLIAPEYTHHDIHGRVENRSQWLESIRTRRSRLSVIYSDVRTKVYGTVAVATGRGTMEDANNTQHPTHLTFTQVFIRTQNGWQRAYFQGTSAPAK